MRKSTILFWLLSALVQSHPVTAQTDSIIIKKLYTEALNNGKSYANLHYLCKKIGGRLSGSTQAQQAVDWAFKTMKEAGADTVYLQECMVPHWVRGVKETGKVISSDPKEDKELSVCALGGSIATPPEGITAPIVEVIGIEGLKKLGRSNVEGKIVFFNEPMNPSYIETFHAYRDAAPQRSRGAIEAAQLGAKAVIVRSLSLLTDDHPHTGAMRYVDSIQKIPACAISTEGADWLSDHLKNNKELRFSLKMSCKTLPDEKSYNVVGEIRGSTRPQEYIVVGGHLDSWDLAEGAQDDGAGIVQSIEVLRIFKASGIAPQCSVRSVAFMNEENGTRGAKKYAELVKLKNEKHIAAIESDGGGFSPRGFSCVENPLIKAKVANWRTLLEPYGLYDFNTGEGGTDIKPLSDLGVPCFELRTDSQRYFDYHHASTDRFEVVNQRELELGGAAMAALIWLISSNGF